MNPPTELAKKDIIRVALERMGDGQKTWDYLKQLGIVVPPQRKVTFTVTVFPRQGDTPENWTLGNVGRVLYHGSRNAELSEYKDVSEKPEADPNEGMVSLEDFYTFAKTVKKQEGYCPEFWTVVERELGVPRPKLPTMTVSFTLTPSQFEEAGVDPDQEMGLSTLRAVLEDAGHLENYRVTPVESNA